MSSRPLIGITATLDAAGGRPRVRLYHTYTRAIEQAGGVPVVLPPLTDASSAPAVAGALSGIVLSGGGDVDPALYGAVTHPATGAPSSERDQTEIALVHAARERCVPLLAICRGVQVLAVAMGGTLVQDIPSECPGALAHDASEPGTRVHDVSVAPTSRLASALRATSLAVNSRHHQAVATAGAGLAVVATAPDGIVEGVEWTEEDWWALGVQWHPEELTQDADGWDRALLAAFVARAGSGRCA